MRRAFRARSFIAVLLTLAAVTSVLLIGSAGSASATSTVVYTQKQTQPIPPAANYAGSALGDGWALAFANGRVFNVFHHAKTLIVACHVQTTAAACPNGPETITDGSGNNFDTTTQASIYLDQSTGKLWVLAVRIVDKTLGAVCVDTTRVDTTTNPFCGFTPLSASGEAALSGAPGRALFGTPLQVGSRIYAFNYVPNAAVSGTKNTIVCFDMSTQAACSGQPYSIPIGSGTVNSLIPEPSAAAIGTDLIIPISVAGVGAQLLCFDTTSAGACSGSWPLATPSITINSYGSAYPYLNAAGTPTGFCLATGTDQCYDLTGASIPTPAGMSAAITQNFQSNGPGLVLGPRVYVPNNLNNTVGCYDYSQSASCPGFPKTFSGLGANSLYTVNPDPQRPTCIWINSDNGSFQIQNFDAYTGGPCTQGRVLASQFVVSGNPQCFPTSYTSFQIVSPTPDQYGGGSVSFADGDGSPIPGLPSVPLDSTGTANLTGLNLSTPTGLPQFLITFNNGNVSPQPLVVKLSWTGPYNPVCVPAGGTVQQSTALDAVLNDGTNTSHNLTEWAGTPVTNNTNGLLTGTNAGSATGTVTYHWWSDSSCTISAAADDTETITTPGTLPASQPVNLPAGTYYETVDYSGDSLNAAASTACGSETLIVNQIPTKIVYTGDTDVYAGDTAHISFVLYNAITNTVLPNQTVTISLPTALGGGLLGGTTDANGVFSTTVTAPLVSTDTSYSPAEMFFGSGGLYLGSTGTGQLTVHVIPTNITYNGTTSVLAGQPANLSFVLKDNQGNVLANKPVVIHIPAAFGGGTASGTTDGNGVFSTTVTAPFPASDTTYSPTETYARQGKYLASTGTGQVTVHVIPTYIQYTGSTEVYAGEPATISFVLYNQNTNAPLPNEPVTITLPDGSTYSGITDANGSVSTSITAPMHAATYPTDESFGGAVPYLASDGPGSLQVDPIPTNIVYTGDTSVQAGQTATISYVLTDKWGNLLGGMPITVNLPFGGQATGFTDPSGVFKTTQVAPMHTGSYATDEAFASQDPYLGSDGPGSIQVTPIHTTITYTGDTTVQAGQTATISYVLKDEHGNTLAGMPITVNMPFGGAPVTGTTNANGVFSTTQVAPMHTGSYPTDEAFASQDPYLGSDGPGSIQVTPIHTSVTYTGQTSVQAGQTATISYVLKDEHGNTLAGMPITVNMPFGGAPVTGTTNANGVFTTTQTAPMHTGTYATDEAFAGQDPYLQSDGPGSIQVTPIPTTVTYTGQTSVQAGQTATISYVLKDGSGNPLANEPITVNLPFGGTATGTTGAGGVYTTTQTAPMSTGSYNTSESFAGQNPYTGSTGPGAIQVTPIPTSITYIGDTTVYSGQSATLTFVLKDQSGNLLPNKSVTISFNGTSYTATTDASGVASVVVTAPIVSTNTTYTPGETFGGQNPYLSSNGTGSLLVKPIPTSVTYTGDTSINAGSTANVSFVLKNAITGAVLPNMPVTITLPGGGTVSGTTNASGVFSTTSAALSAGTYSVSEAFAGQAQYLASSGPGTIVVNAAHSGPFNTGNSSIGFWKNQGQSVISSSAAASGVCKVGTWLRNYKPFQDLSATANCAAVASYVQTVMTNAKGSDMNSMLKAQMLGVALDDYFSTPSLGGNQIGASWSFGDNTYNLTNVPSDGSAASAFGGATSMSTGALLTYAASQSNVGGTTWYGNVKATQTLAKDVFADITQGTLAIQ